VDNLRAATGRMCTLGKGLRVPRMVHLPSTPTGRSILRSQVSQRTSSEAPRTETRRMETCYRKLRQRRTEARSPTTTSWDPSSWPPRRTANARSPPWNSQARRIVWLHCGWNIGSFALGSGPHLQGRLSSIR
jgi:hypothetical protein